MKIFISADIEGVTNVSHWDDADLSKPDNAIARHQMTAEVAAACEGALKAGAREIWVKDAHWTGRNLVAEKLPHEVKLVRGWSNHPFMMMQELDTTFQAVLFVGYHSGAGCTTNPLAHTFNPEFNRVTLNGEDASEFTVNALIATLQNVPVPFISGDRAICEQAERMNPNIRTVAVKEGIGDSTISVHPVVATERIRQTVEAALSHGVGGCNIPMPDHFLVSISYRSHGKAYGHSFYPGARQDGPNGVTFDTDDYFEVLRFLFFAMNP